MIEMEKGRGICGDTESIRFPVDRWPSVASASIMFDFPWKFLIFCFCLSARSHCLMSVDVPATQVIAYARSKFDYAFLFLRPASSIFYLCQKQFEPFKQRFSLHQLRRMSSCLSFGDISIDALSDERFRQISWIAPI